METYNSLFRSAIGTSPFEALYGYGPSYTCFATDSPHCVQNVVEWLQERVVMKQVL